MKNKWNKMVSESKFAYKFEKIIQTLKVAILVDKNHKISSKASIFTWNIISLLVNLKLKMPQFILNRFGEIFVIPQLKKYIALIEEKLAK
ncbi:hypothetical protein [Mycoplasma sp. OR1901]|uniref:hypothetical protein n=1 Tax=Mycoplasma sp. OR1901 TaxID=2742195 RepID=UPI001583E181|nr:hypothetical protein [Mycoplasma sp. OR1901]QKT05180.1 hypothetical protein HTZ87_00400 [Mycoplasma sp. OR1901]